MLPAPGKATGGFLKPLQVIRMRVPVHVVIHVINGLAPAFVSQQPAKSVGNDQGNYPAFHLLIDSQRLAEPFQHCPCFRRIPVSFHAFHPCAFCHCAEGYPTVPPLFLRTFLRPEILPPEIRFPKSLLCPDAPARFSAERITSLPRKVKKRIRPQSRCLFPGVPVHGLGILPVSVNAARLLPMTGYSTVTLFARFLGLSTSSPRLTLV